MQYTKFAAAISALALTANALPQHAYLLDAQNRDFSIRQEAVKLSPEAAYERSLLKYGVEVPTPVVKRAPSLVQGTL